MKTPDKEGMRKVVFVNISSKAVFMTFPLEFLAKRVKEFMFARGVSFFPTFVVQISPLLND